MLTFERAPNGNLTIRRSLRPRLVRGTISWLLVFAFAALLLPLWLAVVLAALTAGLLYTWPTRPSAVFDCDRRVLVVGRHHIPFADLGLVHTIERRDEESQGTWFCELPIPRLVIRYEVYFRVYGEPLILAEFSSRLEADNLADELRSLVGAPT
jgi:hypothetical protein